METIDRRRHGCRRPLLIAVSVLLAACAQGGSRVGQATGSGGGSSLTGGAEAAPTDQATPRSSGGSPGAAGSTLTGGAEGAPTDQATPRGTGVKP
ncbi:hypothetical protein SAMN06265795_12817 [Noviherbaspirillum humi]|uniref:Uncharacterized protein n=1 Tax=Noviherbaspirillum humi TaxID=1688639 RepID=A0A239LYK6_9BURK|nr:hypothetical protein [Noviherbaspirillum humi]SNT35435.1 hypothetical protein SAMN06265795_12817 [Noviherbaspirillum humi]